MTSVQLRASFAHRRLASRIYVTAAELEAFHCAGLKKEVTWDEHPTSLCSGFEDHDLTASFEIALVLLIVPQVERGNVERIHSPDLWRMCAHTIVHLQQSVAHRPRISKLFLVLRKDAQIQSRGHISLPESILHKWAFHPACMQLGELAISRRSPYIWDSSKQ